MAMGGVARNMAEAKQDNRADERVSARLPVDLGNNARGMTRNVSAHAIFFEADASMYFVPGSRISFSVELGATGRNMMILKVLGDILRVDQQGERVGVAVKIVESNMEVTPLL